MLGIAVADADFPHTAAGHLAHLQAQAHGYGGGGPVGSGANSGPLGGGKRDREEWGAPPPWRGGPPPPPGMMMMRR